VESSCEHGNEPSGSIKFWKVLDAFLEENTITVPQVK
jgi:hypothetical protein